MLFTIVKRSSPESLVREVQTCIDGGWELHGDVRIDTQVYGYFQPMTKYEDAKQERIRLQDKQKKI